MWLYDKYFCPFRITPYYVIRMDLEFWGCFFRWGGSYHISEYSEYRSDCLKTSIIFLPYRRQFYKRSHCQNRHVQIQKCEMLGYLQVTKNCYPKGIVPFCFRKLYCQRSLFWGELLGQFCETKTGLFCVSEGVLAEANLERLK